METALSTLGGLFVDATSSKVKAVTPNGAKARREMVASGAIFLIIIVSENEGKEDLLAGGATSAEVE